MIKKNDEIIETIVDMGCSMEGIAKHEGLTIFVPFAIVGEKVKIKVLKVLKDYAFGKLIEVITPSPKRVQAPCPYFTKCGGCDCQHISYDSACNFKQNMVKNTFVHIYKCPIVVNKIIKSDREYFYRNKVALPFSTATKKVGMYAPASHRVVEIDNCLIQQRWVKRLIDVVNEFVAQNDISIYDEVKNTGLLRYVVARGGEDEILVTMVINGNTLPKANLLAKKLQNTFCKVGLNININKGKTNTILTNNFVHISGLKELKFKDFGLEYGISNGSFLQVNNYIKNAIYTSVLDNLHSTDIVLDAYSGAGLMTAMLATKAKHVYGIEVVAEAVEKSNQLLLKNNIKNVTNICGKCEEVLPKLIADIQGDITLVLDPPRKGCDIKVINAIAKAQPEKIIYVSCAVNTLARDVKKLMELTNNAYKIASITPFDMFPQTKHVETLLVLEKIN